MRKNLARTATLSFCLLLSLNAKSHDAPEGFDNALEAPVLQNVQQVTFPWMGFEKAGEGYFSDDGNIIIFQAVPEGKTQYQIYTMDLEKKVPRMVSTGKGACTCGYFRPDGQKIIFASSHDDPELEAIEAKLQTPGYQRQGSDYRWAFTPHMNIYEANLDGSGLLALTSGPAYHAEGAYSYDGKRIVYVIKEDSGSNIYTMDADGGDVLQITFDKGIYNGGPFFSPDGKRIIFRADLEGHKDYLQLYVINSDGTNRRQLTHNLKHVYWSPFWHPDGKHIVYTSSVHDHHYEVYLMNVDTGVEHRLTHNISFDGLPVFNKQGNKMLWTSKRGKDKSSQLFIADFTMPEEIPVRISNNQTPIVSPILNGNKLPFSLNIELLPPTIPSGFHSGAVGTWKGKWLLVAGRTNGLHGFANDNDNFPPARQNTDLIVVDINTGVVSTRSLSDPNALLSQHEIDLLSVTSPQYYQKGSTLYMTGGYGVDTATGNFGTKDALSALDIPGLIDWVLNPLSGASAKQHIRQIFDPIFQITGGYMGQMDDEPTLLVFGQNFDGAYNPGSNGAYSEQVRRFDIIDDGTFLSFAIRHSKPKEKQPDFRRRDLNIVPSICCKNDQSTPYLTVFSGVFTLSGGAWTVPVLIDCTGEPSTFPAMDPATFKQGMNNYICANVGLFSATTKEMFTTMLGGISFGYFVGDTFTTDARLPFINQVTTVKQNSQGHFSQYLMNATYPTILAVGPPNPNNVLLFGAAATFIPEPHLPKFPNSVLKFDELPENPTSIGYIFGGIASTLANTNSKADSSASGYIFKVTLSKNS